MTLDPIIVNAKIPELTNRKYFSLQEQFFWLFARQTGARKIDEESYSVHVDANNDFPDTRYNFTRTLTDFIVGDIDQKFDKLKVGLNRYLVNLPLESAKKSFVNLIISQLKLIRADMELIEATDSYRSLISSKFNFHIKDIEDNFHFKINNKPNSREWTIIYSQLGKPSGNAKFKAFHEKLVEHNLLAENTSYQGFKKYFQNSSPSSKLIWSGTLSELVTFLRELQNSSFVEVDNHWNALKDCFIFTNGRTYSLENLNSEKGTQNSKKQDLIKGIVELLE